MSHHDREVVIHADDLAGDDGAGEAGVVAERGVEEGGEILAAGVMSEGGGACHAVLGS